MADKDVEEQASRVEKLKDAFRSRRSKDDEKFPAQVNLVFSPEPEKAESASKLPEETPKSREAETPKLMAWSPQQSVAQSHDQVFIEARQRALNHAYETRYEARTWQNLKAGVAIDRAQYIQLVHLEPERQRDALLAELKRKERTLLKSEMHDWLEGAIYELIQGHQRVYSTPTALKAVPAEMFPLEIRRDLDSFQLRPEDAGVLQIAMLLKEAIESELLVILVIDTSPRLRIKGGKFSGRFGGLKSQLLWQILTAAYILLGRSYDPRKDTVYRDDRVRFMRLLNEDERIPWGVDELNNFFDERDFGKSENKAIVKEMEQYRKEGRPIVGACSSIWNLDQRMRHKIITHRLEITEVNIEFCERCREQAKDCLCELGPLFSGSATLYVADGTPKEQVEEDNIWGTEYMRVRFSGLTRKQFRLYKEIAHASKAWGDSGGLDAMLKKDPAWLEDFVEKSPLPPQPIVRALNGGNAEVVSASDSTQTPSGVGKR